MGHEERMERIKQIHAALLHVHYVSPAEKKAQEWEQWKKNMDERWEMQMKEEMKRDRREMVYILLWGVFVISIICIAAIKIG